MLEPSWETNKLLKDVLQGPSQDYLLGDCPRRGEYFTITHERFQEGLFQMQY